jgi:hypothetical protein
LHRPARKVAHGARRSGIASVPSIALRVILGAVLVWLIPARNDLQP